MLQEKSYSGIFQDFELLFGRFRRVSSVSMLASLPLQLAKTPQKSFSKFPENISKQLQRVDGRFPTNIKSETIFRIASLSVFGKVLFYV